MNFSNILNQLITYPATEADDITKTVSNMMKTADGGAPEADTMTGTDEARDEDLTKVDGIFEDIVKTDDPDRPLDNPPDNTNTDTTEESTDDVENTEDTEEAPLDDEENPSEDNPDDSLLDDTEGGDQTPKSFYSNKNTLKENLIYFMNILRSNIDSLSSSLGGLNDLESIRVTNAVVSILRYCKEYAYKILTEQMETDSYEALTIKYTTLKHTYDLAIEMLSRQFDGNNPLKHRAKR